MDCSPITQRMASEMLDLPDPLGPTMAVMSSPKVRTVLSGKDLNPWISNAFKYKQDTSYSLRDRLRSRPRINRPIDVTLYQMRR